MSMSDDMYSDSRGVRFPADGAEVVLGRRSSRNRRWFGIALGAALFGILVFFAVSQKPGWQGGVAMCLVALALPMIVVFGPEPSVTMNGDEIRYVRGKHVWRIARQEVGAYRYSRAYSSYITFLGHDGEKLRKEIPLVVTEEEIARAMEAMGIPEVDASRPRRDLF
jgi:hypothetical protein